MFGTMVFNDEVMKERLPEEVYRSLQNTIQNGKHLDLSLANIVAAAMKDWAIEKGATILSLSPSNFLAAAATGLA